MTFDPTQETHEEYLRRMHAKDKLNMEWKNIDQEKENKILVFKKKKSTSIS